ncbi:UNVERIFIED_CONTAM: hypothetical protein NCL1_30110 [Trichonephila clavipes]
MDFEFLSSHKAMKFTLLLLSRFVCQIELVQENFENIQVSNILLMHEFKSLVHHYSSNKSFVNVQEFKHQCH